MAIETGAANSTAKAVVYKVPRTKSRAPKLLVTTFHVSCHRNETPKRLIDGRARSTTSKTISPISPTTAAAAAPVKSCRPVSPSRSKRLRRASSAPPTGGVVADDASTRPRITALARGLGPVHHRVTGCSQDVDPGQL